MQQLVEVDREVKLCSYIDGGHSGVWTFANGSNRKIKKDPKPTRKLTLNSYTCSLLN